MYVSERKKMKSVVCYVVFFYLLIPSVRNDCDRKWKRKLVPKCIENGDRQVDSLSNRYWWKDETYIPTDPSKSLKTCKWHKEDAISQCKFFNILL